VSKRITHPKDLRFVIVRQHMAILTLKQRVASKDQQIQKLEATIRRIRAGTWLGRLLVKLKSYFKGNNA